MLYSLIGRPGPRVVGGRAAGIGELAEPHPRRGRRAVPSGSTAGRTRKAPRRDRGTGLGQPSLRASGRRARPDFTAKSRGWRRKSIALDRLARVIDLAVALRPRWTERAALDEQLSALGPPQVMPERAIERLDALSARVQQASTATAKVSLDSGQELKREFAALAINEALWRQTARIEAFKEQEPLDRPIAGGDRRTAEAKSAGCRPNWPPSASGLGLKSNRTLPIALGRRSSRRCVRPADYCGKAAAIGGSPAGRGNRPANRPIADRSRSNPRWPPGAEGSGGRDGRGRRAGLAVPPPRANRRSARPTGPLPDRIGGAKPAVWSTANCCRWACWWAWAPCSSCGVVLFLTGLLMPTSIIGSAGLRWPCWAWLAAAPRSAARCCWNASNVHQLDACQKQLGVLQLQVQQTKADRDALGLAIAAVAAARSPAGCRRPRRTWRPWRSLTPAGRAPQCGPARGGGGNPPRRRSEQDTRPPGDAGARPSRPPACRKISA